MAATVSFTRNPASKEARSADTARAWTESWAEGGGSQSLTALRGGGNRRFSKQAVCHCVHRRGDVQLAKSSHSFNNLSGFFGFVVAAFAKSRRSLLPIRWAGVEAGPSACDLARALCDQSRRALVSGVNPEPTDRDAEAVA